MANPLDAKSGNDKPLDGGLGRLQIEGAYSPPLLSKQEYELESLLDATDRDEHR